MAEKTTMYIAEVAYRSVVRSSLIEKLTPETRSVKKAR